MTDDIHLYLIETNSPCAESLRMELAPLLQVTVVESYDQAVAASGGLDAIYVYLMSAIEWGEIKIPAPLYQTRVVNIPEDEIARIRPRYGIPGVAIRPGEFLKPVETTQLILRESFKAIRQFNENNPIRLRLIGAATSSLGLDELKAGEAVTLLREAFLVESPDPQYVAEQGVSA